MGQRNWSEDLKNFFLLRVERELEDKLGGKIWLMAFYSLGTHLKKRVPGMPWSESLKDRRENRLGTEV